jgi:hypothetical protein
VAQTGRSALLRTVPASGSGEIPSPSAHQPAPALSKRISIITMVPPRAGRRRRMHRRLAWFHRRRWGQSCNAGGRRIASPQRKAGGPLQIGATGSGGSQNLGRRKKPGARTWHMGK